jgi:uncharacterized protein (TIGR03067 family)
MHSDPQISLHEIGPFLSSSVGVMIHRLSTDQLIRGGLPDKTRRLGRVCSKSFWLDKPSPSYEKGTMMKMRFVFSIGAIAAIAAGCTNNPLGGSTTGSAAERDYEQLSGTWQLTRGVENGKPVPASVLKRTILITDHNTFRFPKASGAGTHRAGSFTVNPATRPKQVDSTAAGGPHAGQLTRGIYEILDANHWRACWGPSGGPRPTDFRSSPGSGRILQDWKKIRPVPSR